MKLLEDKWGQDGRRTQVTKSRFGKKAGKQTQDGNTNKLEYQNKTGNPKTDHDPHKIHLYAKTNKAQLGQWA